MFYKLTTAGNTLRAKTVLEDLKTNFLSRKRMVRNKYEYG
jgi:hypothetical protein